jgi:hypothetical protein
VTQHDLDRLVLEAVERFAHNFQSRHLAELNNPDGTINSKLHNYFVAELGDHVRYYSALSRSLDSSLGSAIEQIAISLAVVNYDVSRHVEGKISAAQTSFIADLLEAYKARRRPPLVADYTGRLLSLVSTGSAYTKRHESDYVLRDRDDDAWYLVELKIGGDLDNKKARSEKEALLEQYAILANREGHESNIHIRFATAYNRYGEGKPWRQERVRQFFADDELLVSNAFWNFITKRPDGGTAVQSAYAKASGVLMQALETVKRAYLE